MCSRAFVLAAAIGLAPLGAWGADLVVWWEEGFNAEEDVAVREIIAAFEQDTGTQVELELLSRNDMSTKAPAAVGAGRPPDFLFGSGLSYGEWAYEAGLSASRT